LKNYKVFFFVSVILALLTSAAVAYGYNSVAGMVPVVVASDNIYEDRVVNSNNVTIRQFPKGGLQNDTVLDIEDIRGKVARGYIPRGTVLRNSMFQTVAGSGVPAKLSVMPGKVAVAIPSDIYTTVGGTIKDGNTVSLFTITEEKVVEIIKSAVVLRSPGEGRNDGLVLAVLPQEAETIFSSIGRNDKLTVYLNPPKKE